MIWILIIIVFLIIVTFLLALLNITLSLKISQKNSHNDTRIMVSLFNGLFSFKIEVPKLALKEVQKGKGVELVTHLESSEGTPVKEIKEKVKIRELILKIQWLMGLINDYWGVFIYLLKATRINKFTWKTEFGVGDPAITGILIGSVWSVKGTIVSLISKYFTLEDPHPKIEVKPRFQQTALYLDFNCIFVIRIGHIIIAAFRFLIKFLRRRG